jgi:hypothetical protein
MTKPVSDYFAHRMRDRTYAAAYQELEVEYQAKRAQIQDRIEKSSPMQKFEEVRKYFDAYPDLMRVLGWLQQLQRQQDLLAYILPASQPSGISSEFQISSEARYDLNFISTTVEYNVDIS